MKKVIITDKNIVQNIIEIDATNETAFKNSLPGGYKLISVWPLGGPPLGGSYNPITKKFTTAALDPKTMARQELKETENILTDIVEKLYAMQNGTDPAIEAWITKRTQAKSKL